ncbi:Titin [Camelus dromedarius]|uniref:Titin n=1 Tax=Camelus dromedarius TaxID=9838 RepID=A0A5N4E6U2_CAMDR|nr:Titin [Camelus dromedarius]
MLLDTNIFKVPEVPKEVVPEKKVPVAVPKKPEVPPAKVPEAAQEVVPENKVPKAPPKKPETPPVTGICWPCPHSAKELCLLLLKTVLVYCPLLTEV